MRTTLAVLVLAFVGAAQAEEFRLTSTSLGPSGELSVAQRREACGGQDISPALAWTGVPKDTQSLAITMTEESRPDTAVLHWIVLNISPRVSELRAGDGMISSARLPPGALHARNGFGRAAYDGICPEERDGVRRYRITIWALKARAPRLSAIISQHAVERFLKPNAIATASLFVEIDTAPERETIVQSIDR